MSRRRQRSRFPILILAFLLLLVCLVSVTLLVGVETVPGIAEQSFGPATTDLPSWQKFMYSLRLLIVRKSLLEPVNPAGTPVAFDVGEGESPNSISFRLEEEGLIQSAAAFREFLIYSGIDRHIQSGSYKLSPAQTSVEIARELQDATPEEVTLNILPGWRAEEIAASLSISGASFSPNEFLHEVRNFPAESHPVGWPSITNVEGFLAPGEYTFSRQATALEVVQLMINRFSEQLTEDIVQGFDRQGLTLQEGVTLASVVQKEGMVDEEDPLIASVFYNRLQAGMRLESDPTVQYAIGFDEDTKTWWKNPLSASDLQFDSPYNTYLYSGLPPGPICNPGLSALRAVAYPAETPYYYFRAKCDNSGRHEFAKTYEEHLQNECP